MKKHLKYIVNQLESAKRSVVGGKEYLIAPVIAITEGVYKGEFVSEDEIRNNPEAWNGRPVVIDHPVDADNMPISANDPNVLSECQIGYLYNVEAQGKKLKGEVWIDTEMANGVERGEDVMLMLENNAGVMEVSTAYFRAFEFTPGYYEGEYYEGISKDIKPDHLAVLLESVGECSVEDGCGLPRANKKEEQPMEEEKLKEGLTLFERGVELITNAITPNKRSNSMDEKIKVILDSGLLAFSKEDLEGMCEDKIEKLHALVATDPKKEKEEPPKAPETNTEEADEDEKVVEDTQPSNPLAPDIEAYLDKQFEDVGGLEGAKTVLKGVLSNESKKKSEIVKRLVANEACPLGKEDLETMPVKTLEALERSYAPASYEGMESGDNLRAQAKQDDLVEYKSPVLIEKE